jgi:hypothetical protein
MLRQHVYRQPQADHDIEEQAGDDPEPGDQFAVAWLLQRRHEASFFFKTHPRRAMHCSKAWREASRKLLAS